ncbi:MAG: helix-turn-helix transcriptional regulator [Nanoarchaeota archaeon]|nr:helix-turn-helix transcriptional regulator [Nanoarchaeota archaeon]
MIFVDDENIIKTYSRDTQIRSFQYLKAKVLRKKLEDENKTKLELVDKFIKRGVKQKEVAARLNISRYMVYSWLNRSRSPQISNERISKQLNIPKSRLQNWFNRDNAPIPIRSVIRLKKLNFLPFIVKPTKRNLWLAGICGFVFGDGHLRKDLKSVSFGGTKQDLEAINRECEIYLNKIGTIREISTDHITKKGRICGVGYELQISHSPFVHLLYSLGVPKGKKTIAKYEFPKWVWLNEEILRNFCRGLLWSEISTPKLESGKNATSSTIAFHMTKHKYIISHIKFLEEFKRGMESFGVQISDVREMYDKNRFGFRILSNQINVLKLHNELPALYASNKAKAFENMMVILKRAIKIENGKVKMYDKAIDLRQKTGWGSPRISKELGVKQSLVDHWIYSNSKPRMYK